MIITNATFAKLELLQAYDLLRSQIDSGENVGTTLEHIIGILFSDIREIDEPFSVETDVIKRGHLILMLKVGSKCFVDDTEVQVVDVVGTRVTLGFKADKSVKILRETIKDRILDPEVKT